MYGRNCWTVAPCKRSVPLTSCSATDCVVTLRCDTDKTEHSSAHWPWTDNLTGDWRGPSLLSADVLKRTEVTDITGLVGRDGLVTCTCSESLLTEESSAACRCNTVYVFTPTGCFAALLFYILFLIFFISRYSRRQESFCTHLTVHKAPQLAVCPLWVRDVSDTVIVKRTRVILLWVS